MDKPDLLKESENNFNIWYDTYDPNFIDINKNSRMPYKWLTYSRIIEGRYASSPIKPINKYVEALYPAPILLDISNNMVTLQQRNHADFFLLVRDNGEFYNVDRPWQRQYYQTKESFDIPENCFQEVYKFYVPWFIDQNIEVSFETVDNSPFYIYNKRDMFYRVQGVPEFVEPMFVAFSFKRVGNHMEDNDFGIIKRNSPMFNIKFYADDILVEKIRKFYEKG
jgi:hypothetical protein